MNSLNPGKIKLRDNNKRLYKTLFHFQTYRRRNNNNQPTSGLETGQRKRDKNWERERKYISTPKRERKYKVKAQVMEHSTMVA